MSEDIQRYEQLVREEDELMYKIGIYQEAISALMMLVHKRGASDLHLLTIEDILMTIHSAEIICHSELLHVRLAKVAYTSSVLKKPNSII